MRSHWQSMFSTIRPFVLFLCGTAVASIASSNRVDAQSFFIGGYGDGIYSSFLSPDGKMTEPKLAVKLAKPSFFAFHPKLDVLYAVTETMRNDPSEPAAVTAYRVGRSSDAPSTPTLTLMNSQPIDGDIPCHVSIDATGQFAVMANYTSGSVVVCPLAADGSIKPASDNVQHKGVGEYASKSPRGHSSVWDPTNRYLFVADLGLDKVFVYELNRGTGKLAPAKHSSMTLAAGSGPRHISIHPNGKWVYVINETNMTLTTASWDSNEGKLVEIQTVSTLPADAKGKGYSTAEVLVHPSGRFVYGSNRGHDTIAGFKVDDKTGMLTPIGHTSPGGKTPRNFRISQNGEFLLAENQQSDSIFSFRINKETGDLKPTGYSIKAPAPACIKFLEYKRK